MMRRGGEEIAVAGALEGALAGPFHRAIAAERRHAVHQLREGLIGEPAGA